ncbi:TPA: histidine triad nucleotide-binding protein [candidate division WWE3 bacterium]|uniref:Histidine triad nucleotide-binding protein n=1 Tax=candidate division WWE3 bacterium TaxID=2053526 RepID=A0A351JSU9_UNCKA|nr:histidine triad nucleotide-binding protein [candidate division WWE3 bacterium]
MYDEKCLFCEIVAGTEPSEKVFETLEFLVIKNKYPVAPVHVLVLDKKHREKKETISGTYSKAAGRYWDGMFEAIFGTIAKLGLDKTGYKLVNNGAGYNHFEHEHFHILGGSKAEPGGAT